jgi:hypothetical protein
MILSIPYMTGQGLTDVLSLFGINKIQNTKYWSGGVEVLWRYSFLMIQILE